jgi:hypothetical protein
MMDMAPVESAMSSGEYGLSGLVISALFAFIWFLVKEHKAERREWITAYNAERQEWIVAYRDQSKLTDDRQIETNTVIRELVSVVRESNLRRREFDAR